MFDDIFTDLILPLIVALIIIAGFCLIVFVDSNVFYDVTVYHLDGTVETFVSDEKPTTTHSFKLKDGTYYDLPDGVKFKYEIVKKSDKGLNIKKDKE